MESRCHRDIGGLVFLSLHLVGRAPVSGYPGTRMRLDGDQAIRPGPASICQVTRPFDRTSFTSKRLARHALDGRFPVVSNPFRKVDRNETLSFAKKAIVAGCFACVALGWTRSDAVWIFRRSRRKATEEEIEERSADL